MYNMGDIYMTGREIMILDKQEILDYLREIKPELEAEGITNLGLFGSYAKNKATEESDIDICCMITDQYREKYPNLKHLIEKRKIQDKISARFNKKVDLVDILGMNQFMLKSLNIGVIYV